MPKQAGIYAKINLLKPGIVPQRDFGSDVFSISSIVDSKDGTAFIPIINASDKMIQYK